MHVRGAAGDIAQGRCLERIPQLFRFREKNAPPDVVILRRPDILKRPVGERRTAVTLRAARLAVEDLEAAPGRGADRGVVAHDPAIEGSLACNDGALVGRQRQFDPGPGDRAITESPGKGVDIACRRRQTRDQFGLRQVHVRKIGDRAERDGFEIPELAVPPKRLGESDVDQRRRAQRHAVRILADGMRQAVTPRQRWIMARCAGARSRSGQHGIKEQHFSKR